jgi:toxin-antitoxin system PIN domain toxin
VHHTRAKGWFDSLGEAELIFCRFTQLGLLRLLTLPATMGNRAMTQRQAWKIYDSFVTDGNARLVPEPRSLDQSFRRLANLNTASPKDWADSYLAAFAEEARTTLVTFDRALSQRAKRAVLLQAAI